MKTFLLLAALTAASLGTAAAQSPTSNAQSQKPSTANSPITTTPNYQTPPKVKRQANGAYDTHPATGPTRASRSSSTVKSVRQSKQARGTGTTNAETMNKNGKMTPGKRKGQQ
ncbi:hypothetical protein GCM10023185_39170 [Hymenobacter saemangeumensis]|uniref:Uncharacterized protein n=1 Tax=Hymenobacter saemangeumensis TaxID=1084522 RepID=A0ABP8IQP6_9BACT